MPRLNIPLSVSIQFDNGIQPPAYGAAAIMTSVSVATDDFDLAVERTADALGTGFVDVRAVSVTFPGDLADPVHPAQAWSDRLTAAIVRPLQPPP